MTTRHRKKKEADPKKESSGDSSSSSKELGKGEFRAGIIRYTKKAGRVAPVRLDFGFQEVRSRGIWLSLIVEFVGTLLLTFISCGSVIAALNYGYNPPTVAIAIIHTILIPIFIYATAAASGGHLNPTISMATVATRLMSPTRGLLYITVQATGAIIGAEFIKLCVGPEVAAATQIGRCTIGDKMNPWGAYGFETIGTWFMLFIAFGTALDPRQREVYGPVLPPFMISVCIGMVIFIGGGIVPGYSGPIMNPARCFGPAVAMDNFEGQLVYWFGPLSASILIAVIYWAVPPQHVAICQQMKEEKEKQRQHHHQHQHNGHNHNNNTEASVTIDMELINSDLKETTV